MTMNDYDRGRCTAFAEIGFIDTKEDYDELMELFKDGETKG